MHVREEALESLPTAVEPQPGKCGVTLRGNRRQHSGGIRCRRSINHILDIWIEIAINGRGILADYGVEVRRDQLRARSCGCNHDSGVLIQDAAWAGGVTVAQRSAILSPSKRQSTKP